MACMPEQRSHKAMYPTPDHADAMPPALDCTMLAVCMVLAARVELALRMVYVGCMIFMACIHSFLVDTLSPRQRSIPGFSLQTSSDGFGPKHSGPALMMYRSPSKLRTSAAISTVMNRP